MMFVRHASADCVSVGLLLPPRLPKSAAAQLEISERLSRKSVKSISSAAVMIACNIPELQECGGQEESADPVEETGNRSIEGISGNNTLVIRRTNTCAVRESRARECAKRYRLSFTDCHTAHANYVNY